MSRDPVSAAVRRQLFTDLLRWVPLQRWPVAMRVVGTLLGAWEPCPVRPGRR